MSAAPTDPLDPIGLIREAYRLEAVTVAECRAIFFDWALRLPEGTEAAAAIRVLLDRHGAEAAHPMTEVLREGLVVAALPRRRGGWRGRRPKDDG